jgi:hypothetical protein
MNCATGKKYIYSLFALVLEGGVIFSNVLRGETYKVWKPLA